MGKEEENLKRKEEENKDGKRKEEERGKLYIVGVGPGDPKARTLEAIESIKKSNVIVAYTTYAELIKDLTEGKEVITAKMKEEIFRTKTSVEKALEGNTVSLVSSGDPQVYGMAGLTLEYLCRKDIKNLDVEIVPGVTAANAAAARLGSPLSLDYVVLSLSDLLIPREEILHKAKMATLGDFVIVLYNPINKPLLIETMKIVKETRKPETPVGIVKKAYRKDEKVIITDLKDWEKYINEIDMITTIIIGNSRTFVCNGKMITPRGYSNKYEF
ncbi:precorrin-3B C(17)-methyltransferase [Acidianus sulfidivorans JP7]|uniref:Precorrin-3B C(17)-methyltransferase n=1 Tax=Acidianus sulfidivorans JP7 TaxID=619593 RepID=A0A2U9IJT6_9CREN|nr:precorrin-3B C(17)-methyltransferase [Acidianus sulfidivorans]AWR96297.1 precorrin-3B C(17)-methyltransferase [Acidianus sulfidivorans JP7]